jgi:Carboxypeptidase regulatory-like domain
MFPLLVLLTLSVPSGAGSAVNFSRVCYGPLHAPQTDCNTGAELPAPAPARLGQGRVVVGTSFIAFDQVDSFSLDHAFDLQHLRRIPFSASISAAERATAISMTVRDAATPTTAKWIVTLSPAEFAAATAIMVPDGRYEIAVSAPHYRVSTAMLEAGIEKPAPATVVMRRIPAISGRVVNWAGVPAFNASVELFPGKHVCTANVDGAFSCEAEGEWPSMIQIKYPGAGTKVVTVRANVRDLGLGDIRLQHAVTLRLHINAPTSVRAVSASLFQEREGPPVEVAARSVAVLGSEPTLLTGFEPGDYRLVVRGDRPLQQYAKLIRIGDSETDEKVVIRESQLTVNVISGGQREPGASVALKSIAGKWRGSLTVDDRGATTEPLWQTGEFSFALRARNSVTPILGHGTLDEEETLQWTLELPAARIEGRVLDEGGVGISEATVDLASDDGEMQTSIHTTSDSNGRFVFDHVRHGAQTLTASADQFLPGEPVAFSLSTTEADHFAELRLRKGTSIRVSVVDRHGVPYPNAVLFESVDNVLVNTLETGPSGDVDVKLPDGGGSILLIAVPISGSFAVRRIGAADREARTVRINVSDGTGAMEIKSETTDHVPIRDVHFLVRYDGETIPFEVLMRLAQRRVLEFQTRADGVGRVANLPPGVYELWPYGKMSEVDTLMSGMDVPAPLRLALGEGLTTATMTFRKKSH